MQLLIVKCACFCKRYFLLTNMLIVNVIYTFADVQGGPKNWTVITVNNFRNKWHAAMAHRSDCSIFAPKKVAV